MATPAPADLQRWSDEVARDPASLAFLPLAEAYRRQGRHDAALGLCLRGLERHPTHVDAHALLARLYLEGGERERACDEWATVLRLDADNFEAHRGMGFFYLERADHASARRHLERARARKPDDPAVREALALLREWQGGGAGTGGKAAVPASGSGSASRGTRYASASGRSDADEGLVPRTPGADPDPDAELTARLADTIAAAPRDPGRVFEPLLADAPFLGALVVDGQGLVLAGTLAKGSTGRTEALGAILDGATQEAARTASHLALGAWRGILLETHRSVVHLAPLNEELVVLVAATREAPMGWIVRTAGRAADLARGFLESQP